MSKHNEIRDLLTKNLQEWKNDDGTKKFKEVYSSDHVGKDQLWIEKQTKRVQWKPDIIVVTKGRKKYVIEIEDGGNNKRKSMFGEILFAFLQKQVSWLVIIMNNEYELEKVKDEINTVSQILLPKNDRISYKSKEVIFEGINVIDIDFTKNTKQCIIDIREKLEVYL